MRTKLFMQFPTKLTDTPVTYELIKHFDLKVNILKANIDFNMIGTMLYDIEGSSQAIAEALSYLKNLGLDAKLISTVITIDEDRCTDCGLCTSVCGVKALTIGNPDWELSYNTDKCVGCNHCIPVCPSRAISGLVPEPIL